MSARSLGRFVLGFGVALMLAPGRVFPDAVGPGLADATQGSVELDALLERAAAYCDRLSGAVLDFVCAERIAESVAEISVARPAGSSRSRAMYYSGPMVIAGKRARSKFLYDYQLVRTRAGEITERRILLEENGHKVRVEDAPLQTKVFQYKYVVMGPVGLLGRAEQEDFDYSVVKETVFKKEPVVIVQAVPKPGAAGNVLYGTIWLRKSDAGILRIEWQPESMGNYEGIEEMARALGMKPRLSFVSEYAFEKNGIRFPSRYEIEEAYASKVRAPLVRSRTEVTYDGYKFFTVETGVAIR